jgi:hypothetical protein
MTLPTIKKSSSEIALYDYKSVNLQLQKVADWISTNHAGLFEGIRRPHGYSQAQAIKLYIDEKKEIAATDSYKQALAMLLPLAAPPPVEFVSQEVLRLIKSRPFGHTLDDDYPKILIDDISDIDPPPSIAAVMAAFREMRLTPGQNVPDEGTVIEVITAAEERFQARYGPLLRLEDRCRKLAAEIPKVIEDERAQAASYKRYQQYQIEKQREE